jgi:AcrR family transcriptional regulator
MQTKASRRANPDRTRATREALLAAARESFVCKGFAATSTPEIVAMAGVTRGALYHHFKDKSELFRALLEEEAGAVAREIEAAADATLSAREALMAGALAYLDAMTVTGRTRLLLIEGPAVLGIAAMRALDEANAERTLVQGLAAAMADWAGPRRTEPQGTTIRAAGTKASGSRASGRRISERGDPGTGRTGGAERAGREGVVPRDQDVAAQAVLLSAAFDRAALAIDEGGDAGRYRSAMLALLEAVVGDAANAM